MAESTVKIERMCYGGAGFGRVEGKASFVPFTAPGDEARVKVVKEKRSYLEGELLEITSPSPLRVAPQCPLFGVCGGCNWQHISYEEQLNQKRAIYADSLGRIGKVQVENLLPVAPSESRYGYRSRIQLKVAWKGGVPAVGFFKTGSHEVVDAISGCAIADPLLNRIMAELRRLLPLLTEKESIPQVDLSMGDDGEAIAILHFAGQRADRLIERLAEAQGQLPSVSGLFLRSGGKGRLTRVFGIDSLSYRIPAGLLPGSREMKLRFGRGGFSQVNYRQNIELVRSVLEWGEFTGQERVLDLYCGNGNISIPVAPFVERVLGIEAYQPSITDAAANASANGVDNADFQASDAALAVRKLVKGGERFDLVILDPPRGGAEAAEEIAALAPEKIIYVSCDPATLARDLSLISRNGYRVTRSRPVDMFPQTFHLESVTELRRLTP